ncbi:hypothetical protein [Trinickia mobilis]|uniref:hypothetical protein n=1 Tax=Trinickia mobilis TaxID=2816356 RepID=UPI001A8F3AC7|nr:hypothetical protein [Trinickia mobilis]
MHDPAWLRFWFEPWHWASREWGEHMPVHWPSSPFERRTLYLAWCRRFALAPGWRQRPDAPVGALLCAAPALLRAAAPVIGQAVRRAMPPPTGAAWPDEQPVSPALARRALGYLAARPLCFAAPAPNGAPANADAASLGLAALAALAQAYAPDALTRIAMMLPPAAPPAPWFACATDSDAAHLLRLWRTLLRQVEALADERNEA